MMFQYGTSMAWHASSGTARTDRAAAARTASGSKRADARYTDPRQPEHIIKSADMAPGNMVLACTPTSPLEPFNAAANPDSALSAGPMG